MTRDEAAAIAAAAGCWCTGKGYGPDIDENDDWTGLERYCDCPIGALRRQLDGAPLAAPTNPDLG
jgi:hypothetical protein